LEQLADPDSALSRQWDVEHDRYIVTRLLEQIRPRFEAKTWAAFHRTTMDKAPPAEVAQELGISVNAVFIAKSRVLTQLRQQGKGLLSE
jgi:RNA polymerase sigma-70 factor (ECF subfamily)